MPVELVGVASAVMTATNTATAPASNAYAITTQDGTVLTASTDLQLAWQWAEHENGDAWATLTYKEQCAHVTDALDALRRADQRHETDPR